MTKVRSDSELKRLASLKKHKETFKAKEQLIRNALQVAETGNRNKITFSDDFDGNTDVKSTEKGLTLFDDDDDDDEGVQDDFDFSATKKTQVRMIANDSRFIIDERFDDNNESQTDKPDDAGNDENGFVDERNKQLEILENVLGKPIAKRNEKPNLQKKSNTMIRYDPSDDDHHKYEIVKEKQQVEPEKKKRKKKERIVQDEEPAPIPVSNEIFYSVSNNLTETLKEQEGFSLLKTFGSTPITESNDQSNTSETVFTKPDDVGFKFQAKNFFSDNLSDGENDEEDESTEQSINKIKDTSTLAERIDTFFFSDEDPRFNDAVEFFRANVTDEAFSNTRRELKRIVRTKIRNNERKNKPLKKSLGMKKRKI